MAYPTKYLSKYPTKDETHFMLGLCVIFAVFEAGVWIYDFVIKGLI